MTTAPLSLPRSSWLRGKNLMFVFLGLMLAYVLYHNEAFVLNARDPQWLHIHPFRWYLLFHGLAGACALLLAPMQFSDRLRRKYVTLHHVVGYIYIVGTAIAAPMGAYIQFFQERLGAHRSFSLAAASQATAWIVTTLMALLLILQGKVDAHRRWMTRSFAVALVFVEVRVVLGVTGWENLGPSAVETVVWACNIFSLLAADIVLQCQDLLRTRAARQPAR